LHDAVALLAVSDPELFELKPMAGKVVVEEGVAAGATIFDRRPNRRWPENLDVACTVDATAALQRIIKLLKLAGERS
jgi:inosine-uridine nucleoside N-ribohydrolase